MENTLDSLTSKIANRQIQIKEDVLFNRFGLSFNPFPRSGISDLNSSDELVSRLAPIDENVKEEINQYVVDSLFPDNPLTPEDKYLSAVIRGDYGYGKTQTLLYIKVLLESFSTRKDVHKNPYVIYIQNPGAKLTELVGSIILQIGEENFKKYLWNKVLSSFSKDANFKEDLAQIMRGGANLFEQENQINPFSAQNTLNFKNFLDTCYKISGSNKKDLEEKIRTYTLKVLNPIFENLTVANYFYDFLLESAGINKIWENLTAGTSKSFDKKEVHLIKAVIQVIMWQGFSDFYILVDEFEAVAEGRLSPTELDRYLSNLRTLIDKERNWCSVFAMTNPAFERVRAKAAPLAQRLSSRTLILEPLNDKTAQQLLINYLNLARDKSSSLTPFDESGVKALRQTTRGNHRIFLKGCFMLIQRAVEKLGENELIGADFVKQYIEAEFE